MSSGSEEAVGEVAVIDPHVFDELQATAGADFVAELVETFAEEAPRLVGELRATCIAGEAERFRRAAHSLKSNAHTFGATALAAHARELELGGLPRDATGLEALGGECAAAVAALRVLAR